MDVRRIDRWLAIGMGSFAFVVFSCTHGYEFVDVPGSTHALWRAVMRAMAIWTGAGVDVWPWHAVVSLFAGLAVALVYMVMKTSLSALMCPEPGLGNSLNDGVKVAAEIARDAAEREPYAKAGAVVGAMFFAFCSPFWTSAISISDGPFEVLFITILCWLLLRCHLSGGREICSFVMFLCGLVVVDSPVLLWCVPVAFAVVVRTLILSDTCSERFLPLYLLSGLAGVAAGLGTFLLLSGAEDASAAVRDYVRQYSAAFNLSTCRGGWVLVWGIPAAVLCLSAFRLRSVAARDEGVGVAGGALLLTLTATVIANALGFPHTVWPVAMKWSYVPVLPSLLLAFAAGGLFSCWLRMGLAREDFSHNEYPQGASIFRFVGLAACGTMVIVLLRQPCLAIEEIKRFGLKCEDSKTQSLMTTDGITVNQLNERNGGAVSCIEKDTTKLEIVFKTLNKPIHK